MTKNNQDQEKLIKPEINQTDFLESSQEVLENAKEAEISNSKEGEKELRGQIEKMDVSKKDDLEAKNHIQTTQSFNDENKINYLMDLAKNKGVILAILVAKKMDNPYVLDQLHDRLSAEGQYQQFKK